MGKTIGRDDWKCSIRFWCERMESKASLVINMGDLAVIFFVRFVSVPSFGLLDVEAMDLKISSGFLMNWRRRESAVGGKWEMGRKIKGVFSLDQD